jgi:glycosyltransferase involved in cell wall biosynthesis
VSVIICCHNSRERIAPTLERLALQRVPSHFRWEVVLVDNCSSDDTVEFALEVWARCGAPAPLRVTREMRLGLSHARLAGCAVARGESVSFVDDDNWVGSNWCTRVRDNFVRDREIGVVGARGRPVFEDGERPTWFDEYQSGYAVGPQRHAPLYFYGAGLSLRRRALAALLATGFCPALLGRTGRHLGGGDDAELCLALSLAGWKLHYDAGLTFEHFIPRKRLSESYLRELYYGFGYSSALQDVYFGFLPDNCSRRRLSTSLSLRWVVACAKLLTATIRATVPEHLRQDRLGARITAAYALGRAQALMETRAQANSLRSETRRWLARNRAADPCDGIGF